MAHAVPDLAVALVVALVVDLLVVDLAVDRVAVLAADQVAELAPVLVLVPGRVPHSQQEPRYPIPQPSLLLKIFFSLHPPY